MYGTLIPVGRLGRLERPSSLGESNPAIHVERFLAPDMLLTIAHAPVSSRELEESPAAGPELYSSSASYPLGYSWAEEPAAIRTPEDPGGPEEPEGPEGPEGGPPGASSSSLFPSSPSESDELSEPENTVLSSEVSP